MDTSEVLYMGSLPLGSLPLGSLPLGSLPPGRLPLGSLPLLCLWACGLEAPKDPAELPPVPVQVATAWT
jgi:hypothetical protein